MTRFNVLDYAVFAVYLIAVVCVGLLSMRGQRNVKDYLLAGRSMGFIIVAISVIAALFSGISYLGAPSEVYAHDMSFALIGMAFFISTPVTTIVFLPFFHRARFYTAYQYLEERFSVGARTLASAAFITRVLLWLALATYAPALALQQVTGIPLWVTILLTGTLTTLYTTLGGMKAVIRTDVMQFLVLFGGQIAIFIVATLKIPGGFAGVFHLGLEGGKFSLNLSLDPTVRVTFWGLIIGGAFMNLVQMATDQVSVQRYMTATSLKEAQRSLWLKLALTLPVIAVFYGSGVVLYAFYHVHPDRLDPTLFAKPTDFDKILPYFVVNELPVGMPGVLIAAIYAASMGVTSSGINALTTATLMDFYQRLWRPNADPARQLTLAKRLTVMYGAIVLSLAFVIAKLGTLLEASNKAIGLAGGPLLGLFLLGMLSRRANAKGAVIGWVAGVAVLLPVCFATKVSFLWFAMIGCTTTMTVGWISSLFTACPDPKHLEGLVFSSRYVKED
jgi:SSS family transporter